MSRRTAPSSGVWSGLALVALAVAVCGVPSLQAQSQGRFLGREDITLYGLGLQVQPAQQTVPKGFATIVSTYLQTPQIPGSLPPFAPDAEVRATLRGPSFEQPLELVAKPNSPLNVPILTVPGTHTVENIRLVSGGEVLLYGSPQSVRIDVIEKLLVTTVTARPLTADEIREKGIVFDRSNYQAYNFTAAFAVEDGKQINISFPVVLPTLATPSNVDVSSAGLTLVDPPLLRDIATIIPDTLRIQSRIPNLSVTGFTLTLSSAAQGQDFYVPPIPGVIVIPGDIGFLNQYFSVMLMVANVAPNGSNLVVSNLSAAIVLPPGNDSVVGSDDDPLRMAQVATGESPRVQLVRQPGPDGKLGTGDDITTLGPGETGSAEYLIEGRREGTWAVEMEMTGTLTGMPVGPVSIRGRAAGCVLVRNPKFTLTFTHPEIVNAGEPYTLDVTVTNTSEAPANLVSVNLFGQYVSGARLNDEPTKTIDSIAPGDSASVTFNLISQRTGRVTAATLDSDDNVAGQFALKTGVGEFGIPLSPDSLVLPKEAGSLPQALRDATLGLLGRAWAAATAPPAAFPKNLTRFSKQVVLDRAVETAEAGFRTSLGEPLPMSAANLLMDFLGSEYLRLGDKVPVNDTTGLLALLQRDVQGFDLLRRLSFRGDVFADQIAATMQPAVGADPVAFHRTLAEQFTSRPGHLSVFVSTSGATALPVDAVLTDAAGRRLGGLDGTKTDKEIPFGDALTFTSGAVTTGKLLIIAVPEAGQFTVRLARNAGADPAAAYSVSVAYPGADGRLRFASFTGVGATDVPQIQHGVDDPIRIAFELTGVSMPTPKAAAPSPVSDPAPTVLGAVQIAEADIVGCTQADSLVRWHGGRVVAVLFSEEVTAASVQDKLRAEEVTAFSVPDNRVVGVALQPGRRIAFVALREPVGPFVDRTITVKGVADTSGQALAEATLPIRATVTTEAGVVSGQVLNADGTPAAFSEVRLFYEFKCDEDPVVLGIASQNADAEGRYQFDYVLLPPTVKLVALDGTTDDIRIQRFKVARNSQRLNVNVVFIGRGTFAGRTLAEDGTPLANSKIRVTSLTDQSQYGATSDALGHFEIQRVPVGNIVVEAVNTDHPAQIVISERIPVAGATITRDLTLLNVDMTGITVKTGNVTGRVMQSDGVTPVEGVPVVAYYRNRSQTGVRCPPPPPPFGGGGEPEECAIAVANTGSGGVFSFPRITAGELRINSFDQAALQEGQVRVTLAENQTVDFNLLLGGGFGTVRGVVLDQDGRPVPDAEVGGGLSVTKVNPADGTFTLIDVPVGRREIVAVSQAMASTGKTTVDIVRQGEVVNATIVLDIVGAVAGRVFDHAGVPQTGINVYVTQDCYDEAGNDAVCVRGQATTGLDGAYRVNGLLAGKYRASAFRANMRDGNIVPFAIRYQGQVLTVDVTFRGGGGTVSGRVLRAKPANCVVGDPTCVETPLSARVAISGDQLVIGGGKIGVRFEYVQNFTIVDNDSTSGAFSFSNLWTGPFTVRAAGQFSPEPVAVEGTMPGPGQTVTVDLRLQPTSRITGTVYEPDGVTPVTGRQVSLKFKSNAVLVFCHDDATTGETNCVSVPQGIQEVFAVTDTASGQFSFPIVNAGAFTITANDGSRVAEVKGSVKAGETVELSVRLLARGRVTIRVIRHNGQTLVPGASVHLQQIDYPKTEASGTAVDGTIAFESLGEGQFAVSARDANGFGGRASGRIVRDGDDVTVIVYLYDATGTVVGLVTRLDDQGAPVSVPNAEAVLTNSSGPIAFAITDATGSYSVSLVPLGAFDVDGFDPVTAGRGRTTGTVAGGSQDVVADLRLEALGVIRGVLLESGTLAPLKGWQITLSQATPSGRGLPTLTTTTSVDGSFSFPGASVGSFSLNASRRGIVGEGSASGQVSRAGQLVEVQVVATIVRRVTGRVTGLVANPNGSPASDAQVEICSVEGCRPTAAGADGRFLLDDVPLGRFTVRASAQVTGAPSVGTAGGALLFEGDMADVTVTLLGLSAVEGTVFEVVNNVRTPAAYASVRLYGQPGSGCPGACLQNADANGHFSFVNVPARTFTVAASNGVGALLRQGSVGGVLNTGETKSGLEVVLEPAVSLSGRVLLSMGAPAAGIVAELTTAGTKLYAESGPDGLFSFQAVKAGAYALRLQDPVGPGIAKKSGTVDTSAVVNLGDITLDETPPGVGQMTPADGAINVSLAPEIRVTFTEPVSRATVNDSTIQLVGPSGPVTGEVTVPDGTGDTVALFRLLGASQLASQARYSVRVSGVEDRLGKKMVGQATSTFTTLDITPPSILETTPAASTTGVTINTVVRVKFSEVIDATKFSSPAIVVAGPGGPIEGRVEMILASTVAVFTPTRPLLQDTAYTVSVAAATDLAGLHSSAAAFSFATTDGTPPQVLSLTASNLGHVIENTTSQVTATISAGDVAFVDFFINDVFINTDRTAPFAMTFQALPAYGMPGGTIKVSAVATDTSGNRGTLVSATVTVDADHAPSAVIDSPLAGTTVTNNQVVQVRVHGTDDVGVNRLAFKAALGSTVIAALSSAVTPATDRTANFSFTVPATAAPGSPIVIEASAADTKGQATAAAPVTLTVVDTTGPTVAITAPFTGSIVQAGQVVTAVVTADDPGGVASIGFRPVGIAADTVRPVSPAQKSVVTSFSFTVSANAEAGSQIELNAFAIDATGNRTNAGAVRLLVADAVKPTTTLRTATGSADMVRGRPVSIDVQGSDNIAVSTLTLTGTGAFAFSSAFSVPGTTSTATHRFTLDVPADVPDGAIEVLTARATDWSGNQSTPVTLTLTARPIVDVIMPLSVLIAAGETQTISVGLPAPAAASVTVQLQSASPGVATITPSVTFNAGETSKTATVTGISGGTAQIDAYVSLVQRASTTVTVRGGIVHGTVTDGNHQPVSGAQVTIFHNSTPIPTTTIADGTFGVEGVVGYGGGRGFTVQATDGDRLGKDDAQLDVPGGSATVTVIILPLSVIHGTVLQPGGSTPVAAGVQVDLYESSQPAVVLHTAWTDDQGAFEFRLVAPGSYLLVATDLEGNRGRASAVVSAGGQDISANVTFLGRGSVTGLVQSGIGAAVPNASVELHASSIFGQASTLTATAGSDGRFSFENVFVGSFSVMASDANTHQGGSTSGSISMPGQTVDVVVRLSLFGNLQGTVFRSDGSTTVPGATVSVSVAGGNYTTATDIDGHYSFSFLPFATTFTVSVNDPGTRAIGRAIGGFTTSGETVTRDVVLKPQGTLIITVVSSAGVPVNDAAVHVTVQGDGLTDTLTGQTGPVNGVDGQIVLTRLLAGAFTATASKSGLSGATTGTVVADQQTLVTIQLEAPAPTGAIIGTVRAPDGVTAAIGSIRAMGSAGTYSGPILADGTFDLQGVRLGTYRLDAFDANGRFRAFASGVVIGASGQVESRDLVFVGLGTVTGMVTNAFGVASGLQVAVHSLNPNFGGYFGATTGAAGQYEIGGVPVGGFTVSTSSGDSLRAEATGAIDRFDQVVTVNLALEANTFTTVRWLYDANDSSYAMQPSGFMFAGGVRNIFAGGAAWLDIIRDGTRVQFSGGSYGTYQDGGRETVGRQANLHGLNVTRKFFVPENGYFARVLETLTNPTTADITVDVVLTSNLTPSNNSASALMPRATSSGNTAIEIGEGGVRDHWVVMDDYGNDVDAYSAVGFGVPVSFVFDGGNALKPVSMVSVPPAGNQVEYRWESLTIPAGGTVTLMHFVAQQVNRNGAVESGRRLVDLPPEALSGLGGDEIASIVNFVVPQDGIGTLAPLPAITGVVSGTVVEGDGVTPVPGAVVYFRAGHSLFGRVWEATADPAGAYAFTGAPRRPVPLDLFELRARHPVNTATYSPFINSTFAPGETTAVRDIVFTTTGLVSGTVRRTGGALVTSGTVTVTQGATTIGSVPVGAVGQYAVGALPPASYAVTATTTHPQGTGPASPPATAIVVAGQITVTDLTIEPTGRLQGIVYDASHAPVASTRVEWFRLNQSGGYAFYRSDYTDELGRFASDDMPVGSYTLRAYASPTNLAVTMSIEIVADTTAQPALQYPVPGMLTIHVQRTNGLPLQGIRAYLWGDGWSYPSFVNTDASGDAVFHDVRIGEALSAQAYDTARTYLYRNGTITLRPETGGAGILTLTMPPFGDVTGAVRAADGVSLLAGTKAQVRITTSSPDPIDRTVTTDGNSGFAFDRIFAGRALTIRTTDIRTSPNSFRDVTATIPNDGDVLALPLRVPAVARVVVTVKNPDGSLMANADVRLRDNNYYTNYCSGNPGTPARTTADGVREFAKVPEGPFEVALLAPGYTPSCNYYDENRYVEKVTGQVTQSDDGQVINLTFVPRTYTGVAITGTIMAADGATPVSGWSEVYVYRAADRAYLGSATTDGSGRFSLPDKTVTGAGVIVVVRSPGMTGNLPDVVVPMPEAGGTVLDVGTLTIPVRRATVIGRLLASDGTTLITGDYSAYQYTITNDNHLASAPLATGSYAFPERWLAVEGARVKVYVPGAPNGIITATTGPITTNGQVITLDLVLPLSVYTTVAGQVVAAGDGATPINGASVDLLRADGGSLTSVYADQAGRFFLTAALPADGRFKVRAHSPTNWDVTVDIDGQATVQAQPVDVGPLLLPVSVVAGAVTYDDGPPVANASVFAMLPDGSTQYASGDAGRYWFYGLPTGTVTLTADDGDTGLTTSRMVTVDSATSVVTADLRMPPTGTVMATVVDEFGNTVVDATVALVSDKMYFEPRVGPYENVTPTSDGHYVFSRVPTGGVYLQARRDGCNGSCQLYASGSGMLAEAGGTLTIHLGFQGLGPVTGQLLDAVGNPLTGRAVTVDIDAFGAGGPMGHYQRQLHRGADAEGPYIVDDVPPGPVQVRVSVDGIDGVGVADGVVSVAASPQERPVLTLDVRLGTAVKFVDWNGLPLDGSDSFRYTVGDGGAVYGSRTDDTLSGTLSSAVTFAFKENGLSGAEMARPELGGRQLVVGPLVGDGASGMLHVTRKVYVPADGRFARHLDVVTNPTGVPVTTEIQLTSETMTDLIELSQPSATAAGFARFAGVVDGWSDRGTSAFVFSGVNPLIPPTRVWRQQWSTHSQQLGYAWTMTVPPSSSVALLHFVTMDLPDRTEALGLRAARLAALVEPGALDGLTDDELGQVVNFRDPGARHINLRGTLLAADGVTGLPGRTVEVYQERGNRLLATLTSASDGSGAGVFTTDNLAVRGPALILRTQGATSTTLALQVPVSGDGDLPASFVTDWMFASVRAIVLTSDGSGGVAGGFRVQSLTLNDRPLGEVALAGDSTFGFGPWFMPAEGMKVRVFIPGLPGGFAETQTGPVTENGQELHPDITLPASVYAIFHGRVRSVGNADGIETSLVSLLRADTRAVITQARVDIDGMFHFSAALPASGGYIIRVESPTDSQVALETTGTAVNQRDWIEGPGFELPISTAVGKVAYADLTGVPFPTVFAVGLDGFTTFATVARADGTFAFYGLPAGTYRLTAQDPATGVTAVFNQPFTLDTATSNVWYLDWNLPPTGAVTVRAFDLLGAQTSTATVALVMDGLAFEPRIGPNDTMKPTQDGRYVFERVPYGAFYLHGTLLSCESGGNCRYLFASSSGNLSANPAPPDSEMHFSGYGQVRVNVIHPQAGSTTYQLDALGSAGPLGTYSQTSQLVASTFLFDFVPPGPFRVTIQQNQDVGVGQGVLEPGATEPVVIGVMNNSAWGFALSGVAGIDDAEGFRYSIGNGGAVYRGGTTGGALTDTFLHAASLHIGEDAVCCVPAAAWDLDWRQLVFGPMAPNTGRGLVVTRKVYVSPATQGRSYVRYLDRVANPTDVPVTVTLSLRSTVEGGVAAERNVVSRVTPSADTGGYSVISGMNDKYGASAYVFSGQNPPVLPSLVAADFTRTEVVRQDWTVRIEPHSSVALLHFVAERMPGEVAEVQSVAQDLANLTEYATLTGLPEEDLAAIVNFALHVGRTASVTGKLLASDGTSAIAGQRIDIIETVGGQVLRSLVSGSDGSFAADNLLTRDGLRIRAYVQGLPGGWMDVDPGPVAEDQQPLTKDVTLPASVYARLEGSVKAFDAVQNHWEAIDGPTVLVLRPGTRETLATTTANAAGVFGLWVALPADGLFILRAESPTGSGTGAEVALETHQQNGLVVAADPLVLPISTMIGLVTNGDGTPVAHPTVFARHTDGITRFATRSRSDGTFALYELPAGDYRLTAQDPVSGLTAELPRTVTLANDLSHMYDNDWALPQTGTVVVTPTGTALTGTTTLALVSNDLSFERWVGPNEVVKPGADGRYVFQNVPFGTFYVQGKRTTCDVQNPCRTLWASAGGNLDSTGTPLELALPFDGYGEVEVDVLNRASGLTLIAIDALGSAGPLGAASIAVELDADSFRFGDVPPGLVRVFVRQGVRVGLTSGALPVRAVPGTPSEVVITASLGSAREFTASGPDAGTIDNWGEDGLHYPIDSAGQIVKGGILQGEPPIVALGQTLKNAAALYLNDNLVWFNGAAVGWDGSIGGRQATLGPAVSHHVGGLTVTRKVFVPDSGGFARFLDVLSNPTGLPVTVKVRVGATIEGAQPDEHGVVERGVVERGDLAMTGGYVVIGSVVDKYGASAYVYSGVNPPTAPSVASFDFRRTNEARVEWRLTLQPGQSVALLHFVVQRLPGDVAGATSRAQSLAGPLFVNALVGLTVEEKVLIINFRF